MMSEADDAAALTSVRVKVIKTYDGKDNDPFFLPLQKSNAILLAKPLYDAFYLVHGAGQFGLVPRAHLRVVVAGADDETSTVVDEAAAAADDAVVDDADDDDDGEAKVKDTTSLRINEKKLQRLQTGGTLFKYGRFGKPKQKFVRLHLDDNGDALVWQSSEEDAVKLIAQIARDDAAAAAAAAEADAIAENVDALTTTTTSTASSSSSSTSSSSSLVDNLGGEKASFIRLTTATRVVAGKESGVFEQSNAAPVPAALCFTVFAADRTLDLQAESEKARDKWVSALKVGSLLVDVTFCFLFRCL
jgi:hypothetical protein